MVNLAIADNDRFRCLDMEIRRPGDVYKRQVYWNGCCTERTITGEEKLDKRNHTLHREGVWTI